MSGARPADQALVALPSSPQAVSTEGFDPSRERPILEWGGLRVGAAEHCYIKLGDAEALAQARYYAKPEWGHPLAASCFVHPESGAMRLVVVDYLNGRRLSARHSARGSKVTFGQTPWDERRKLITDQQASPNGDGQ